MAQCDLGYEHEGEPIAAEPEAAPVVVENGPNENDVKIAEVEAAARIETEKIWTEQRGLELESEVGELRGELRGIREAMDRLAPPEPEAAPDPVVLPVPEPTPAPEPEAAAPPEAEPEKKAAPVKKGFF